MTDIDTHDIILPRYPAAYSGDSGYRMILIRICAWCQNYLGALECPEPGITHGICRDCRSRLESEYFLQMEHLKAGLTLEVGENDIWLKQAGQIVAVFSTPVNRKLIIREADKHLEPDANNVTKIF